MAPLRSHTHLEYTGDAQWTELPREQHLAGGRPKSADKAEAMHVFGGLDAEGVEINIAAFAKAY